MSAADRNPPDPREPRMRISPEFDLIGAIRDRLAATGAAARADVRIGIGDDAAVVESAPGARAVSVDAIVDGVAFRRRWCPPRAIGRKAIGSALSDLAAMGARAREAYVWLGAPEDFGPDACLSLCDGLAEVAERLGVVVLGGDLTRSPVLAVSVTAIGHTEPGDELLGRAGASEGDALCATGAFGGAAAGLMLLEHPELGPELPADVREAVVARQLAPEPRLAAGAAIAAGGGRVMIDVSDGLGADAEHLAAASGLGIEIELDRVPVAAGVHEVAAAAGRDPGELIAAGGEDYELLCAVPRGALSQCVEAVERAGSTLTEIGRFVPGSSVRIRLPGGRSVPPAGHDHLRSR
jgi:thiamine-monophosphate kinase